MDRNFTVWLLAAADDERRLCPGVAVADEKKAHELMGGAMPASGGSNDL
jgi:hypothetical protein